MKGELVIELCEKENIEKIVEGINQYNLSRISVSADFWTPLDYVVKDENGNEMAGILAGIGY